MITLCFDFGNTRLKVAIFQHDQMQEEILLPDDSAGTINDLIRKTNPQHSILSSVIDHNPEMEKILAEKTVFHKLSASTIINFSIPAGKPETVGADRLALCAAAVHYYPGKNNLVIGLGTCITYNFIDQQHQFLGGGISPGMEMRFKAMHDYTAKLPLVEATWNIPLIGYDTKTNLQSGVLAGMACEIDGIIGRYSSKYGNFNVVLTGGNSAYFAGQIETRIFADHNFLYKGLYALSQTNNLGK